MIMHHYSAEENGFETIVKIRQESFHYANKYGSGWKNVIDVLYASKDEDGYYYWGVFDDHCDKEIVEDREAFLRFMDSCDDKGYSVGAFDSIEDVNKSIEEETDLLPIFGSFDSF